jgi:hypothetical protein
MLMRQMSNDNRYPLLTTGSYMGKGKRQRRSICSCGKIVQSILLVVSSLPLCRTVYLLYRRSDPVLPSRQTPTNKTGADSIKRQYSTSDEVTQSIPSIMPQRPTIGNKNDDISSVDYMACCGLGHRLSKMADAYYLSQQLNFTLRGYWGYCDTYATIGRLTEVFQYVCRCNHVSFSLLVVDILLTL